MFDLNQFILSNLVLIAEMIILIVFGIWMIFEFSKYYLFREVYLAETKGDRKPRYIGRQIVLTKSRSKICPKSLRRNDDIKMYLVVREGFPTGSTKKIAIPNNINVAQQAKKTVLYNAKGLKHDYNMGYYVPFNEYVEANSPSENVFFDEMDDKLKKTDAEVTKAVACSHQSKQWHNMYNSIPVDTSLTKEEKGSKVIPEISSTPREESEAKKKAKDNLRVLKEKYSEDDALEELGGLEL